MKNWLCIKRNSDQGSYTPTAWFVRNYFTNIRIFFANTNISTADILALSLCLGIANSMELNICQNMQDGVFIRDHSSCSKYIACHNQMSLFGECPHGFAFNPTNSMCDYPDNVDCVDICPQNGTSTFRYERSCTKYIRCIGGHSSFVECPEGLYYDHHHGNCNVPEETDCEEEICQSSGTYLTPSHEDCAE